MGLLQRRGRQTPSGTRDADECRRKRGGSTPKRGAALSSTGPVYPAAQGAERAADVCVLALGLVLGICAAAVLLASVLRGHHRPRIVVGAGVYAAGLLAMLGASLLYRSSLDGRRRLFLRRLDHAAIFAMIAATATPFALARAGPRGIFLSAVLWTIAAVGIAVKLRYPIVNVRRSIVVYLALGWASAAALGPSIPHRTIVLIAAGGICYSAGVTFLLWRRLPYHLAIWHLCVLVGAALQYLAILDGVVSA